MKHKAGFVNIIGSPNVGKSTLMNGLVGERLSIITSKAQTTRHRIMGIVNGEDFQIVYSDTPGVLDAKYKLQESMMNFVGSALADADIILLVTDLKENELNHEQTLQRIEKVEIPVLVLVNKADMGTQDEVADRVEYWRKRLPNAQVAPISALHKFNLDMVLEKIKSLLPENPPFFPKDELTDRPMRFFMSEIIREKILLLYKQEIPYASEVLIEEFKEEEKIIRISAVIIVNRDSQKGILIGKKGSMLKRVGTEARKDMEVFLEKKVFLQLYVKVDKDWRENENKLKKYGYLE
ncbi:GTPase Era [Halocola ammonii]